MLNNSNAMVGALTFEDILQDANARGQFSATVLASGEGLPIASAPPEFDGLSVSAILVAVQELIQHGQSQLGLAEVAEVSIVDGAKQRIVCRSFSADGQDLTLVIVAPEARPYRRLAKHVVRDLLRLWTAH